MCYIYCSFFKFFCLFFSRILNPSEVSPFFTCTSTYQLLFIYYIMCVEDGSCSVMFFLQTVVANNKYPNDKLGDFLSQKKISSSIGFTKWHHHQFTERQLLMVITEIHISGTNVKKCWKKLQKNFQQLNVSITLGSLGDMSNLFFLFLHLNLFTLSL